MSTPSYAWERERRQEQSSTSSAVMAPTTTRSGPYQSAPQLGTSRSLKDLFAPRPKHGSSLSERQRASLQALAGSGMQNPHELDRLFWHAQDAGLSNPAVARRLRMQLRNGNTAAERCIEVWRSQLATRMEGDARPSLSVGAAPPSVQVFLPSVVGLVEVAQVGAASPSGGGEEVMDDSETEVDSIEGVVEAEAGVGAEVEAEEDVTEEEAEEDVTEEEAEEEPGEEGAEADDSTRWSTAQHATRGAIKHAAQHSTI